MNTGITGERMQAMYFPTIHLNGTSAADLLSQLIGASNALGDAITKMQAAAPNGRDYDGVQAPGALSIAVTEYSNRVKGVDYIKAEIDMMVSNISDQIDQQQARRAGMPA